MKKFKEKWNATTVVVGAVAVGALGYTLGVLTMKQSEKQTQKEITEVIDKLTERSK